MYFGSDCVWRLEWLGPLLAEHKVRGWHSMQQTDEKTLAPRDEPEAEQLSLL